MVRVSFCLDRITLEQLAKGRVAEPECSHLEAHVRSCPRCGAAYEAQFTPLIEAIRTPPPAEDEAERRLIEGLIEKLKALRRPSR